MINIANYVQGPITKHSEEDEATRHANDPELFFPSADL